MTIEQITTLVNAGFTKDEIMAMTAPAQQTAQEPAQQEISLADVIKSNQAVMENISKLTAAVQANAIRTAVQPNGGQPAYTAEQAIAEIIAPPRKERI